MEHWHSIPTTLLVSTGLMERQTKLFLALPLVHQFLHGNNSFSGIYFGDAAVGKGFRLTVPATTSLHKLKVYVGVWCAEGNLTVTLSDGSATFTDISKENHFCF